MFAHPQFTWMRAARRALSSPSAARSKNQTEESMSTRIGPRWLALLAVAMLGARELQAQAGRITGLVTDSAVARPIAGVEVIVVGGAGSPQIGARTDAEGRYTLNNVAPGQVRVRARMPGFAPKD